MKNNYYNIVLIMGTGIIAGAINYAYYPLMLQYMSLEDFGLFGSIMGILNLIAIITNGIIFFLNKEISKNIKNISKVKHIYLSSLLILSVIGVVLSLVFGLLSPIFAGYFNIQEQGYFWLVGVTIIVSFCSAAVMATLRGLKKFGFISAMQIISPVIKVLIGISLLMYGFNIYGAIYGVVISGILGVIVSITYLGVSFRGIKKLGNTRELIIDFKRNKKDLSEFFLISFFFALFMNIDVIFVQNIFDSTLAGVYVGLAILGKFLVFLLLSIETVYYGQILEYGNKTIPKHLIKNPLILMGLTIVSALIFNIVFGEYILHILKPELQSYMFIYILSLIYYGLLAYISFFSKILVAWGDNRANKILLFFVVLLIILAYTLGQQSLEMFISCFIATSILCSISLGALFFRELNNKQGK